ncbi:MAG: hypothetical protein H7252_08280, partial [Cytophaga sp.]|nr:hypothetical protein [Undibacterium sp.]
MARIYNISSDSSTCNGDYVAPTTLRTFPVKPEKQSVALKISRLPLRVLRAAIGTSSRNATPSPALAATKPNALPYSKFSQSQHPSSGPVQPLKAASRALAPLTVDKLYNPVTGPLINNKNEVESRQAAKVCRNLVDELEHAQHIIYSKEGQSLSLPLQKTLIRETEKIRILLDRCCHLEEVDSDNMHQYLRDNFSEIALTSKKIRDLLPAAKVTNTTRNPTLDGVMENKASQLSHFFDDFYTLANEIKRHHYDRASQLRLNAYADQEYKNLVALVPALALQRKGSELVISKECIATVMAGIEVGSTVMIGGTASYTYTVLKRMFADLDGDACVFKMTSHALGGGPVAKIKNLFGRNGEKNKSFGVQGTSKLTYSTGDYIDYKNWREYFKAEVIHDSGKRLHLRYSGKADGGGTQLKKGIYSAVNYIAGDLLGVKNLQNSTIPRINQKKREKGMNNADRIIAASLKLQTRLPGVGGISKDKLLCDIVGEAYPRISAALDQTGIEPNYDVGTNDRFGNLDVELDAKIFSTNADLVASASPATRKKRGRLTFGGVNKWEGSASVLGSMTLLRGLEALRGMMRFGASASGDVICARQNIKFLRLKPVHEQLDPGYNQDIAKSEELLKQLGLPSKQRYYSAVLQADVKPPLLPNGGELELSDKFNNQFDVLYSLRKSYIDLTKLSGSAKSFANKNYQEANTEDFGEFKTERDNFIVEVFGIKADTADKDAKKFLDKLLSDPEYFMVKAYDALSTRLGRIGVDVYKTKEWMATKQRNLRGSDTQLNYMKCRKIDLMYGSLKNIMDGVFLPISKEKLLRGASVQAHSESDSFTLTIAGQARAQIDMNPLKGILGNESNPTLLSTRHAVGSDVKGWTFGGGSGPGFKLSFASMDALLHPNPARRGIHRHTKLSGTADGVTPLMVKHAMETILKFGGYFNLIKSDSKIRSKFGLDKSDAANAERMQHNVHTAKDEDEGFIEDSMLLAKRTLLSEYTGEYEIFLGSKAPPSVGKREYEFSQQYVRYISRDTQRAGATIGVPMQFTGVPVTPSVGVSRTCADGNVLLESLGVNLSYQLLSFNEMQMVLDKSINKKTRDDDPAITKLD